MRILGLFSLVPVCVLVTLSFFVLFAVNKTDAEGLKKFGRIVAVFLWVSAAALLVAGAYILCGGCRLLPAGRSSMPLGYTGRYGNGGGNVSGNSGDFDVIKGSGSCDTVNDMPLNKPKK